jgi:hypothetical protein
VRTRRLIEDRLILSLLPVVGALAAVDTNEAGDLDEGVKAWLEDNRNVVQPWTRRRKGRVGA